MASLPAQLKPDRMPRHVAIIMDGNGRWAKQKGGIRLLGHKSAIAAVRDTVEGAAELGIEYLTLFAFSTENWERPRAEVDGLMKLLVTTLRKETATLQENNIKLHTIGNVADLPKRTREELEEALAATADNSHMTLTLALSYGGRRDILAAVRMLAAEAAAGRLHPEDITEATLRARMSTHDLPDPDLLVRSSGELRVSNFLLWEMAYTEFVVSSKLWPDFRRADLVQAIAAYQSRERRFGKTSEQITAG